MHCLCLAPTDHPCAECTYGVPDLSICTQFHAVCTDTRYLSLPGAVHAMFHELTAAAALALSALLQAQIMGVPLPIKA